MKKILICLTLLLAYTANSQIVKIFPPNPTLSDTVTLTFDATQGNKALCDIRGQVFVHTGLITSESNGDNDWKFVSTKWNANDPTTLMKSVEKNIYTYKFTINSLYKPHANTKIEKLAFVFRNHDGSRVAKNSDETDIIININDPEVELKNQQIKKQKSKLINIEQSTDKWTIETTKGFVIVKPYSNDVVEVSFQKQKDSELPKSHAVIAEPKIVNTLFYKMDNYSAIQMGKNQIVINHEPFYLSFINNGDTLMKEESGFFAKDFGVGVRFKIDDNEEIYGAGERSFPMNRRGNRFLLYNRPHYFYEMGAEVLNYSVPLIFSSKNYAFLWDNPQKGYVDIGKAEPNIVEWQAIGGTTRYYFITGDKFSDLVQNYVSLTGYQEMPPRWALGNLQSRMAYRTQYETDSILRLMQEKDFPVDAMIIDFYWFGDSIKGHLGKLDWYKKEWHNPEKMIKDFKNKGIKTIIITEPYIIDTVKNFVDAENHDIFVKNALGETYIDTNFYFGNGSLIDIFKPEAREWFWEKYNAQIKKGIAGWWGDLGEPESHPSDIVHVNGSADEVHNIYGHYWDKMLYDKYCEHYPDVRLFHLQRSGYAGSQRYSAYPWTGDVARTWGGFQAQLPLLLTMSISGLGYIHSDAGGFALGEADDELYTRWLQFACFTPILRPHGSGFPSEPVYWSENSQDIVRRYIKLRYAMLPYNYTLAYQNSTTGEPLMAPLFYYYPEDEKARKVEDQFMWGSQFLIAPVIQKGQTNRNIYLPKGNWVDFFTLKTYEGERNINYSLTLDDIPIFVREGSIIPLTEPLSSTDYYKSDNWTIRYYPSETKTSFTQFEDDGITRNTVEKNQFELIFYNAHKDNNVIHINVSKTGKWKKMPKKRKLEFEIFSDAPAASVEVNGVVLKPEQYFYSDMFIKIPYLWKENTINIKITK